MDTELLKALPGGGSLAVLVVLVYFFLKHIKEVQDSWSEKTEKAMSSMADKFDAEHAATRVAFQDQIERITSKVFQIAESTTLAVKGLENAVRDLQEKIK